METLLNSNFILFYGLPSVNFSFCQTTDAPYFEIEDTETRELRVHESRGGHPAKILNPKAYEVLIVNYDLFISNCPHPFQKNRKRCDLIMNDNENEFIILGELKDRGINELNRELTVREIARMQLLNSLETLRGVPQISDYFNGKAKKLCCYFNSQSVAPSRINATDAFNRLPNRFPAGFRISCSDFEGHDFEFWEYTGTQTLTL